ncbi:MAG: ABC transporter ATP-binding protein [Acetivibrionales bacterium]|jgi:branched-chain amino acid transport system ATP-binding protein
MPILEIVDLVVNYGSIKALKGINFSVNQGEVVTLIGSNGAGKSTTMNTIASIVPAKSGKIIYKGTNILNRPSDFIVKSGIVLSPEGRQVFPHMTVFENLMIGAITCKDRKVVEQNKEKVFELFPVLKERMKQYAGTLSGGEQQSLAVGRALMGNPSLLMLDEPSLGLAPLLIQRIFDMIVRINRDLGITVLIVEQNARMALSISHKAFVLETGKIILSGTGEELANNPQVKSAYLGG